MEDLLPDLITNLVSSSPTYAVLIAGAVWAVATWEKHPRSSLWALAGFAWLVLVYLSATAWRTVLVVELFPEAGTPLETASYFFFSVLEAVGFAFLMVAAFGPRRGARRIDLDALMEEDDFPRR